jgi:ankyrin repeat protein
MNSNSAPANHVASHTPLASEKSPCNVSSSSRGGHALSETVLKGCSSIPATRVEHDISGPNQQQDAEFSDLATPFATPVMSENIGNARDDNHAGAFIVQNISGVSATAGSSLVAGINVSGAPPDEPHLFYEPSYEAYKNINRQRVPGTCEWVFKHPIFQRWRDSDREVLLWLSADPGCGKSVISRALIDEELAGGDSAVTGYYFFKDNEEQRGAARAVCALLYHIFASRQHLFCKYAVPAIKKKGSQLVSDFEELWRLLIAAGTDADAGKIICVLDALDECQQVERAKLLGKLDEFVLPVSAGSKTRSNMKFFVTSRPYHEIERLFPNLAKCVPSIRLAGERESGAISEEINLVIKAEVRQIQDELHLSEEIHASLETRLSAIPHRTYLWLRLILAEIRGCLGKTRKKLLRQIDQLPETVNEAYEMLLAKCAEKEKAKKALHIIIAATRPLNLKEMDVALEIEGKSRSYEDLDLEEDENREAYIRNLCGLFVTVVDEKIYLIHQTAKEFLVRQDGEDFTPGMWKHSLVPRESHRLLAEICITHLFFDDFRQNQLLSQNVNLLRTIKSWGNLAEQDQEILQNEIASYSLLSYSANHWAAHFRKAGIENDDRLTTFALNMFVADSDLYRIHSGISYVLHKFSEHGIIFQEQLRDDHIYPLRLAAAIDLEAVVKLLLKTGVDVNVQKKFEETSLIVAARKGHTKIVELLLDAKPDINLQGGRFHTALQAAAAEGSKEIVELLLEAKADVNLQGGEFHTALHAAAYRGSKEIVELLLEAKADVNLQGGRFHTALHAAAYWGSKEIVELLLEAKADINLQGGYYHTALQAAAAGGSKEIVELLLEAKADVNLQGGRFHTALQAAAAERSKEIVELLPEAKADVNLQGGHLHTALQAAAAVGSKEIVELLLEAGADVHLHGGNYGGALQAAIFERHHQIEELLILLWLQGLPSDEVAFRNRVRSFYPCAQFERCKSSDRTLDRVCVRDKWYEVESGADNPRCEDDVACTSFGEYGQQEEDEEEEEEEEENEEEWEDVDDEKEEDDDDEEDDEEEGRRKMRRMTI